MERGRPRGRAPRPADRAALEAPPPPETPRWSLWPVLLSAIAAFVIATVATLLAARLFAIPIKVDQLTPQQVAVLTGSQDLTLGVVLLLLLRAWPKVRPADLGFRSPLAPQLGLVVGAGLWVMTFGIAELQAAVFGAHPQSLIVAASANRSVEGLVLYLVFGAALTGVAEELFFRAALFTLFRQRMRFVYAAVVSSTFFMLVHEITAWLPVFAVGMALAFLYEKRHSLWTNAVAHGTFNAISFVLLFVLPNLGS
jgi:membrane protease YdiL (CAAX protease family)